MARLAVMYRTPKGAAAFDKHHFETHVSIARKISGLRKYEVGEGPVATPAGPSAGADMQDFASGGADLLMFDSSEV